MSPYRITGFVPRVVIDANVLAYFALANLILGLARRHRLKR